MKVIEVDHGDSLVFEVECMGMVNCEHAINLNQDGQNFWEVVDNNWKDKNPNDLDREPHIDHHPTGNVLENRRGTIMIPWRIFIGWFGDGEVPVYDVSIRVKTKNGTEELGRFRNTDNVEDHSTASRLIDTADALYVT